ncbi:polypyrimidine tract-binding protein 2-like [Ostrea edulis]|uniref:polypyrimidine tract-binding protein 2-like n=1 Tax=Ostrea edulis TaxID=37623 RepID=UPI002095FC54|nr:polypyrimidine tract-binding protein 2-like [Ostrea edulis]XP_048752197.1 polypyrimidine tract-binding protein 2-like [Ostrea edulis]
MVLCPGFKKNGRPCTNILEQKSKYCKMCGWKIDPEIFQRVAISCPNIALTSKEQCGTWIEKGQIFCDQCGWEVNQDLFGSQKSTDSSNLSCNEYVNLQTQMKKITLNKEQTDRPQDCSLQFQDMNPLESPNTASSYCNSENSASLSPREGREVTKGRILFVHNLNEEKVTVEGLFNLFGIYGRVEIVKLFYNRKSSGLIQMNTEEHATLALNNLDRLTLWNNTLHIQYSRVKTISVADHAQFTKDYRNCRIHRGGETFKYVKIACAPSPIIHLANLLNTITKEDIMDVFLEYGNVLEVLVFRSHGKQSALVRYSSVEQSALAVMAMHNFPLPDKSHLIVSFSHHKSLNMHGNHRGSDTERNPLQA